MPIRFACPHCQQRLSVAQQKAGTTAECPRCKRSLTIPQPPEPSVAATPAPEASQSPPPLGQSPIFLPDAHGLGDVELVYNAPTPSKAPTAGPGARETIVVPRYVIYVQGMLLAVVALVAFAIGILMGTTLSAPAGPSVTACTLTGTATYASGPRRMVDEGAVVVLLPQSPQRPDEKAPVRGLRPGDPPPEDGHRGLSILRQSGGAYGRTNAKGRFQLDVPSRGRYLLLVISNEKRRKRGEELTGADLLNLGRYFDDPATLLSDRQYRLSEESIRGDRQFTVAFGE
jgi:hypothetical protein